MKKILLVEDEMHVVSFIQKGLSENNYSVSVAFDGESAWQIVQNNTFDFIILDIMIPKINGIELCKKIRSINQLIPILFLSALGTSENIVLGLESGADDYLVKPFKFIELLARIKTLIRRSEFRNSNQPFIEVQNIYKFHDIEIDDDRKSVKRAGKDIHLTTTEYRLLLYFVKNNLKVLSRIDLLENVWDMDFNVSTNVVDVYVNYLRKKIDLPFNEKLLHTVIGMGYILKVG